MRDASTRAAAANKNVILIFHASWCGWCHKMDSSLSDPACKAYFDRSYVIAHVDIDETPDHKQEENPGAYELRKTHRGEGQGLPYWVILDPQGNLLADSQLRPEGAAAASKGDNIGCPAAVNEVSHFISILRSTSHITPAEEAAVAERFRRNED